ncbi:MAG: single-stranded-DNA-specific exonuclease RecJ [Rubrivivax sp.]|nr:single-stranded-DNA-specific exonuclease RecJ [Rubrivivax sp.]
MILHSRDVPPRVAFALEQAGVHPLLARLLAARGVREAAELDTSPAQLLRPDTMKGAAEAGRLLADAIERRQRICIVADYDCDGATACAVALRGLAMLGAERAQLAYVVPDRVVHGYGLTPAIVELAMEKQPDVLVTVDNGIASHAGVAHARARGLAVLVTDHHLPAANQPLPEADVIANPNQPGCSFASKAIAGVGVMFYVLLATRAELRARGRFDATAQPKLETLLDLVALGTVADVVKLDANNRRLVALGLKRVRAGLVQPGVAALFSAAGRLPARASTFDFGYALGPRINAAGRLADMTLGIECLLADDIGRAAELAHALDTINRERREVEGGMRETAERTVDELLARLTNPPPALALFDESFHEGVVGIVAGRVKDRLHRPAFVFARGRSDGGAEAAGALKGSGRSIPGFHLRDALDLVAKREPGLLARFGGHAMAAGCTLAEGAAEQTLARFDAALQRVAAEWLDEATLTRRLATDGPLPVQYFNADTAALLAGQVWGQGFEAPLFCDEVQVVQQRLVGEKHLKLRLRHAGAEREGIWFGRSEPLPERARLAWRMELDEWNGQRRVQMVVEAAGE